MNLQTPSIITSPSNASLSLTMFKGKEGIQQRGVSTYEGVLTYKELVDHFGIEDNSDVLSEEHKKQRDVGNDRVNGLKKYWQTSKGTVLPSMTLFVSEIDVKATHSIGGKTIVEATLNPDTSRLIGDGQGRTTFLNWLLSQEGSSEFESHTICYKLVVTHTVDLNTTHATDIIRQTFSDYHSNLKKPNKSISKHFDSSTPLARLVNDCLKIEVEGIPLIKRIALHDKIKQGHVWTFQQLTSMLQKFLKLTPATAIKQLNTPDKYDAALSLCTLFLTHVFKCLPAETLDSADYLKVHDNAMFTRAIFANALGLVGRSLFDEILIDYNVSWTKIDLSSLPIDNKDDPFWIKAGVTFKDGDKIKIIKATDTRIGSLICRQTRIYPCLELSA